MERSQAPDPFPPPLPLVCSEPGCTQPASAVLIGNQPYCWETHWLPAYQRIKAQWAGWLFPSQAGVGAVPEQVDDAVSEGKAALRQEDER